MRTIVVVKVAVTRERELGDRGGRDTLRSVSASRTRGCGQSAYRAGVRVADEAAVAAAVSTLSGWVGVVEITVATTLECPTQN